MKILVSLHLTAVVLFCFTACGGGGGGTSSASVSPPPIQSALAPRVGPATCLNGSADGFACDGIDLSRRVPYADMDGRWGNDIWGWFDAQTNREYALVGMNNGTAFVDVTNPLNPVPLGRLPTQTSASDWRDIKTYQDFAYIVADNAGNHGMQVFDLRRLRGVSGGSVPPQTFTADAVYGDFANAHNLAINESTGFAYAVGTNTCAEGLHMIDVRTPNNPMFAGCFDIAESHDAQCVSYAGPDVMYSGNEICFSSNEDHIGIVNVTDKSSPAGLSMITYPQRGFVHQGWLTEDHRYFLVGDEFDEIDFGLPTRTHVLDIADLDSPSYLFAYESTTVSIDHNLYIRGDRVFEANYTSGLRVLRIGDLSKQELTEVAFFDTFPASDAAEFNGVWSVYPYLPSGTIVVSDISNGLFVLRLQ